MLYDDRSPAHPEATPRPKDSQGERTEPTLPSTHTPSPLQHEIIDIFVRIAQFMGLPRSVGEIYGFIYAAEVPPTMEDCVDSLRLSKGAASQGLKQLREMGAVKVVYSAGDRRDHYETEENLRHLVTGFLNERVLPGLEDLGTRLRQLESRLDTLPPEEQKRARERLAHIQRWQQKANTLFPLLKKLLIG